MKVGRVGGNLPWYASADGGSEIPFVGEFVPLNGTIISISGLSTTDVVNLFDKAVPS
jgi:hypothetical protein